MTACRLRVGTGSEAFSAATSKAVSRRCHSYGKYCGPGGSRDLRAVQPPFHFLKVCVSCLCGFQNGSYDKAAGPSGTQRPGLLWHLLPISYLVLRNWKKTNKQKAKVIRGAAVYGALSTFPLSLTFPPADSLRRQCCCRQHLSWAGAKLRSKSS